MFNASAAAGTITAIAVQMRRFVDHVVHLMSMQSTVSALLLRSYQGYHPPTPSPTECLANVDIVNSHTAHIRQYGRLDLN
jgi:hypothetical protein